MNNKKSITDVSTIKFLSIISILLGLVLTNPVNADSVITYSKNKNICKILKDGSGVVGRFDSATYCHLTNAKKVKMTVYDYAIKKPHKNFLAGICSKESNELRSQEGLKLATPSECLSVAKAAHYLKEEPHIVSQIIRGTVLVMQDQFQKTGNTEWISSFRELTTFYNKGSGKYRAAAITHMPKFIELTLDFQDVMLDVTGVEGAILAYQKQISPKACQMRYITNAKDPSYRIPEKCTLILEQSTGKP